MIHRLWILHGKEKHSGKNLGIIYTGNKECKNYISSIAFDGEWEESDKGNKSLWHIFRLARKNEHSCSMMILNIDEFLCRFIKRKKDFYIPSWVDGEVDIPLSATNKSAKRDLGKIRKSGLKYELTTEESAFHNFYYDMYVPYLAKKHGSRAKFLSYDKMMKYRQMGIGELLLIKKKDEYIAGQLILFDENGPHLELVGIKDGSQCYFQDGVSAASYYFSSCYLHEKGYRKLSVGGSRPFLHDGVLHYKRKWGLRLIGKSEKGFLIKRLSACEGLKGFFNGNPFIYMDEGKLCGAVFVENDANCCQTNLKPLFKRFYINGLSGLKFFQLIKDVSVAQKTVFK
jgi:hypothetical protein